jgi:hypothetical protein
VNGNVSFFLRPNSDSNAVYGYQQVYASNITTGATRSTTDTNFSIGNVTPASAGLVSMSDTVMYAKTGASRKMISSQSHSINGTTVDYSLIRAFAWNDTSTNITSLEIYADQANGLGSGTLIELWAYRP